MIASIHTSFASDRGSTRWWAAITSAALIVAAVSLPAVAADTDPPPRDEAVVVQVEEQAAVADEAAEPVVEEPVVEEPVVEEPVVEEPVVEEPVVEEPAAPAEEPAPPADEMAPAEEPAPAEDRAMADSPTDQPQADTAAAGAETNAALPPAPMAAPDPVAAPEVASTGANYISLDFVASEPSSYDHDTGGGFYADRTIGVDVVESLEGGDFICGDIVTFLTAVTLDGTQANAATPRTLELDYQFLLDSTGQTGVALGPVEDVMFNAGDPGNSGSAVVEDWDQVYGTVQSPPYFVPGEVNDLTVVVSGLTGTEQVIIRVDVVISCQFAGRPTGNLQAAITSADVTDPPDGKVPVGQQTVPFKSTEDIVSPGRIIVDKVTDPSGSSVPFPFRVEAPGVLVDPYLETFSLTDAATPWASGDIHPTTAQIGQEWVTVAGAYAISENLPSGWQADDVTCVSSFGGGEVVVSYPTATSAVLTLREGETVTCTFENSIIPGSIGALKYEDLDGNGNRDAGEPVLPGWTIFMDEDGSATLNGTERSAVTDASGQVVFDNVMPGFEYRVCEVPQAGWINTEPGDPANCWGDVLVEPGQQRSIEFGNFMLGSKSGMKFVDVDGDGAPFEQGVDIPKPGHVIVLMEESLDSEGLQLPSAADADAVVAVVSTDAQGRYAFTSVLKPMTTYYVVERCPLGWVQTYPNGDDDLGTCDHYTLIDVPSGFEEADNDFGNFQLGSKSGYKWNDLDGDGIWDEGEPAIPGVTIELRSGDQTVASTKTDSDGRYEFAGLLAGEYTVAEVCGAGWIQTYPATDGSEAACGEGVHAITVVSGYAESDNNFGNFALGTKGGYKWNDLDGDGVWDEGEPTLPGWTINLLVDGTIVASTVTDSEGYYEFGGLPAGDYVVSEACPAGWMQTFPPTSGPCGSGFHEFSVGSGFIETDNNFGNFQLGSKSGYKWNDVDGDGTWDAGEPGLNGVTIQLWSDKDGSATVTTGDAVIASTVTATGGTLATAGYYQFTGLMAGKYVVAEVCQSGWAQTSPMPVGGVCGTGVHPITVTSGYVDTENNFGNFALGTKGGYKWNDVTPNGIWDVGEPGINGVTVQLWKDADGSGTVTAGDTVVASTVTASGGPRLTNGYYAFAGLTAGKYVVAEVCQAGWVQSAPAPVGGVCGTGVYPITVTSGFTDLDNNFGNYVPGVPTLDKTSVPGEGAVVEVDDAITFTVTVGNTGGAVISGPVVDTLPIGLRVVAGTVTGDGAVSTDGRTITWQVTLLPAATVSFSYDAEVVDAEVVDEQVLVNTATFLGLQDRTSHVVNVEAIVAELEDEEEVAVVAATGADGVGRTVSAALVMLLAGGLMVVIGRRRNPLR